MSGTSLPELWKPCVAEFISSLSAKLPLKEQHFLSGDKLSRTRSRMPNIRTDLHDACLKCQNTMQYAEVHTHAKTCGMLLKLCWRSALQRTGLAGASLFGTASLCSCLPPHARHCTCPPLRPDQVFHFEATRCNLSRKVPASLLRRYHVVHLQCIFLKVHRIALSRSAILLCHALLRRAAGSSA